MSIRRRALLLVALFALSTPAQAAITFVIAVSAGGDANTVTTAGVDTSGANLIVCVMSGYEPGTAPVITDSKSNTWQTDTTLYENSPQTTVEIVYTHASSVGAAHTFTATGTGSAPGIACAAFAGAHASAAFDQENGAHTTISSQVQTGSITPSQNDSVVIAGLASYANTFTASINSSMTIAAQTDQGTNIGVAIAYIIQTTAGAINPTWTTAAGNNNSGAITSFKVAAAGGATPRTLGLLGVGQ
jgi:hypothetical protein